MQFVQGLTGWIGSLLGELRNRLFGGLDVHVERVWPVGEKEQPALCFNLWVENNMGEGSHLRGFRVRLREPVEMETEDAQPREPGRPVVITLPISIGPWQASSRIDPLIIHFDSPLPQARGRYRGDIVALGRGGRRAKRTPFECDYDYRPQSER